MNDLEITMNKKAIVNMWVIFKVLQGIPIFQPVAATRVNTLVNHPLPVTRTKFVDFEIICNLIKMIIR